MGDRILIAEDEPFIVESLDFLLSREGYEISSVSDGDMVCETMQTIRPALLILDIMLPSANGFDILRRLRSMPETSKTPVLVLTAKGQESDRVRMQNLGADSFMTKPFSNRTLVEEVHKLTGKNNNRERTEDAGKQTSS